MNQQFTYSGAWNWLCIAIACWSFSSLARLQWQSYKTRHKKKEFWKYFFITHSTVSLQWFSSFAGSFKKENPENDPPSKLLAEQLSISITYSTHNCLQEKCIYYISLKKCTRLISSLVTVWARMVAFELQLLLWW